MFASASRQVGMSGCGQYEWVWLVNYCVCKLFSPPKIFFFMWDIKHIFGCERVEVVPSTYIHTYIIIYTHTHAHVGWACTCWLASLLRSCHYIVMVNKWILVCLVPIATLGKVLEMIQGHKTNSYIITTWWCCLVAWWLSSARWWWWWWCLVVQLYILYIAYYYYAVKRPILRN